eukprot:GFKZ01013834.1.p2 GENE.GFKZ01013834.1~~GFKZ01013834.1.p2  ORF type:complete len:103 (-),score=7.24 GFKZ01013834.1:18-326(-)
MCGHGRVVTRQNIDGLGNCDVEGRKRYGRKFAEAVGNVVSSERWFRTVKVLVGSDDFFGYCEVDRDAAKVTLSRSLAVNRRSAVICTAYSTAQLYCGGVGGR